MEIPEQITLDIPYVGAPERTHRVVAYRWGNPALPPVMCIHGLTRNARDFDFLAAALAHKRCVIALDMPGRGKSEWLALPEEYSVPHYLANLQHIFARLNLTQVEWVGTSMGGLIGMALAAHMPGFIRKLVLNDVGAYIPAAALARIASYVGKRMAFSSREVAERALREIYAPFGIQEEAVWQHLFAHSMTDAEGGSVSLAYDPAIAGTLQTTPAGDIVLWEAWEKITCPTLVVRGGKSDILLAETAEEMLVRNPHARLFTVPNAGHAPSLTHRDEIEAVRGFLLNPDECRDP